MYRPFTLNQQEQNKTLIFPWELRSGYVNLSERGYLKEIDDGDNTSFFQKVFTGKDSIIATWQDSTRLVKLDNENKMKYEFNIGKWYSGNLVSGQCTKNVEITDVVGMDNFLGMKATQDIQFYWELVEDNCFNPSDSDLYKLYTIPELGGNRWFVISNVQPIFDENNEQVAVQVSFTSLNDKLNQSGKAVEQFVQYGAPGEPYAKPKIIPRFIESGEQKQIDLDSEALNPKSASCIQVEQQGSGTITSITVIGRKLTQNENGEWITEPWEFLLPSQLFTPEVNPLNKSSIPTKNFYYLPNETLTNFISKPELDQWKNQNSSIALNNSSGKMSLGELEDWTKTNGDKIVASLFGQHKSNVGDTQINYYEPLWRPLSGLTTQQYSFTAQQSMYAKDDIVINTSDDMRTILAKNSIIYLQQLELPYSYTATKPYRMSNIPVLGKLITMFCGDRVIASHVMENKAIKFGCFISADLANLMIEQGYNELENKELRSPYGFISSFGGDQVPKYFGANVYNTTLFYSLTNLINTKIDGTNRNIRTGNFGQIKDENGNNIKQDGSTFWFPNEFSPISTNEHFVVDKVMVQGLFSGDYRISFYDNAYERNSLWATTIQSTSKWLDNSYRNWTTEINTGCWNSKYTSENSEWTWPIKPDKQFNDNVINVNQGIVINPIQNINGKTNFNLNESYWTFEKDSTATEEWEVPSWYTWTHNETKTLSYSYQDIFGSDITTYNQIKNKFKSFTIQRLNGLKYASNWKNGAFQNNTNYLTGEYAKDFNLTFDLTNDKTYSFNKSRTWYNPKDKGQYPITKDIAWFDNNPNKVDSDLTSKVGALGYDTSYYTTNLMSTQIANITFNDSKKTIDLELTFNAKIICNMYLGVTLRIDDFKDHTKNARTFYYTNGSGYWDAYFYDYNNVVSNIIFNEK